MENGKQMAFPTQLVNGELHTGLTKREYFAAMAMQGVVNRLAQSDIERKRLAEWSVKMADEILKELETKSE
jgi:hypothetical protein